MAKTYENVGLMEEGEVVLWEASPAASSRSSPPWRRTTKVAVLSLGAAALAACGVAVGVSSTGGTPQKADVGASVGLGGFGDMLDSLATGLKTFSSVAKDTKSTEEGIGKTFQSFGKPMLDARDAALAEVSLNETARLKGLRGEDLFPSRDDQKDGNPCPDDEEHLTGLCYKKCSDLTDGDYPIRTTAFACCRAKPCSIFNSKTTSMFKICGGNDVAGDREGGACPHVPGDCLRNEEYLLGSCYKRCSIVASAHFAFRTGPNTCCKYQTKVACMDAINTMVSSDFNVGGGINDVKYNATYGASHTPIPALAEKQTTTVLPAMSWPVPPPPYGAMPPPLAVQPIAMPAAMPPPATVQPIAMPEAVSPPATAQPIAIPSLQ